MHYSSREADQWGKRAVETSGQTVQGGSMTSGKLYSFGVIEIDGQQYLNNAIADRRRASGGRRRCGGCPGPDEVDDASAMLVAWSPMRSRFLATRMSSKAGNTTLEIAHHVGKPIHGKSGRGSGHLIVGGEDALRELDVAADDGVEGIANHFLGELAHARQIDVGLDARMPEDAERALGDVDGLIADALEIVVDAGNKPGRSGDRWP